MLFCSDIILLTSLPSRHGLCRCRIVAIANINIAWYRSYHRCSYNKDHQCGARKHKEKIKDNPPVYRTTYFGQHICKPNHDQGAFFTTVIEQVDVLESVRMIHFGKDLDQEKKSHSGDFSLLVKHEEDFMKNEILDQYFEINGADQDVLKENLPSSSSSSSPPSGSYPTSSSFGSESDVFNSELVWDNLNSWDCYDRFDLENCIRSFG